MATKRPRKVRRRRSTVSKAIASAILGFDPTIEEIAWWANAQLVQVRVEVYAKEERVVALFSDRASGRSLTLDELKGDAFTEFFVDYYEPLKETTRLGKAQLRQAVNAVLGAATQQDRHRLFTQLARALEVEPTANEPVGDTVRKWALRRLLERAHAHLSEGELVTMHREALVRDVLES